MSQCSPRPTISSPNPFSVISATLLCVFFFFFLVPIALWMRLAEARVHVSSSARPRRIHRLSTHRTAAYSSRAEAKRERRKKCENINKKLMVGNNAIITICLLRLFFPFSLPSFAFAVRFFSFFLSNKKFVNCDY